MSKYSKSLIFTVFFVLLTSAVAAGILYANNKNKKVGEENPTDRLVSEESPQKNEVQNVSTPNSETEVYILKYNPDSDKVELVTKKTDGTEIVSPVDNINPFYLTEEDMKKLSEGIVLTSREDMFILIEDFSS